MSTRRNSKTPCSKKDSPVSLAFHMEDGKSYRPYTDPVRIKKNDEKKAIIGDARARVKGVPNDFLSVMTTTDAPSSENREDNSQASANEASESFNGIQSHSALQSAEHAPEAMESNGYDQQQVMATQNIHCNVPIEFFETAPSMLNLHLDIPSPNDVSSQDSHDISPASGLQPQPSFHECIHNRSCTLYQAPQLSLDPSYFMAGFYTCPMGGGPTEMDADLEIYRNESFSCGSSDFSSPYGSPGSTSFSEPSDGFSPTSTVVDDYPEHITYHYNQTSSASSQSLRYLPHEDQNYLTGPGLHTSDSVTPIELGDLKDPKFFADVANRLCNMSDMELNVTFSINNDISSNVFTSGGNPNATLIPSIAF